jgi:hypothetical protein
MPESGNPLIVALRVVFGPLVKQSSNWPPVLAYGLPGIVAVLLIVLLRSALPNSVLWLVAAVIVLPLVGYIITVYIARRPPPPLPPGQQKPDATIVQPTKNQIVERTIHCSGTATGVQNNLHLWLAVETHETEVRIWPKGEVLVDNLNRWSATIFEDGATKRFSISLFIANPEGDKIIRDWLENGRVTGEYPHMTGIAGSERLDRVGSVRLRKLKATQLKNNTRSAQPIRDG